MDGTALSSPGIRNGIVAQRLVERLQGEVIAYIDTLYEEEEHARQRQRRHRDAIVIGAATRPTRSRIGICAPKERGQSPWLDRTANPNWHAIAAVMSAARAEARARNKTPERAICARMSQSVESLPLPDHPVLAAWASALNATGYWASLLDAEWRCVFATDERTGKPRTKLHVRGRGRTRM